MNKHLPRSCTLLATCGLLAAGAASAATFDPTFPSVSINAPAAAVSLLPGASIARTEMITGTQSIVLPFVIPIGMPGGTVTVSLADLAWPSPMSSLSFAASTSTSLLVQLSQPGTASFDVTGPGNYFASVYGVADPAFGTGLYSLNLSYSPVPLPAAAWLLASGLGLFGLRRRQQSVINAS